MDSKRILLRNAKRAILFPCELPSRNQWLQRVGKQFRAHIQSNHGAKSFSRITPNFRTRTRARFNDTHIIHSFHQHFARNFVAETACLARGIRPKSKIENARRSKP